MSTSVAVESSPSWVWRTAGRRWVVTAFFVVAAGSCALILTRPGFDQLADLKVYWGAIRHVTAGGALYDFRAANGDPFTYPPFAEVLLSPMGRLPFFVVGIVWTVAALSGIAAIGWVVAHRALSVPQARRTTASWLVALGLLVSAPGQSDIRFGQVSLLLVLACLADGLGVLPERYRGILTGLAAAVKLTPLLFIIHLLIVGRRREAVRAIAAFAAATLLGFVVLPGDSWTYWTSAIFATDRIGDIAALGNQSLNGLLLRAGVPEVARPFLWAIAVAVLVVCALLRARSLTRVGQPAAAVVLVGCATLAASPVSWTHHQFWTVLAGMLLIGAGGGLRRAAGWALVAAMTLNLADLAEHANLGDHALFLAANTRGLAVCVLCVLGLPAVSRARTHPTEPGPGWRPDLKAVGTLATALLIFALIPVPSTQDPLIQPFTSADAVTQALRDGPPCATEGQPHCTFIPMWPDFAINYGTASTDSGYEITGFVSEQVTRLVYLPAPGADPVTIPLGRIPTTDGIQAFTLRAGDTTFAQLKAYDNTGALIGEFGNKLRI